MDDAEDDGQWEIEEPAAAHAADPAVDQARELLKRFFDARRAETFYEQQLAVMFESRGRVNRVRLTPRGAEGDEEADLGTGFFHWVTGKALKQLRDSGAVSSELVERERGDGPGAVRFYHHRSHRYWARQRDEVLKIVDQFSALGRAIGHHGEAMVDAAIGSLGFKTLAAGKVRIYEGREWIRTGHDLDRLYARDGVVYGAEIKNTLKYIPPLEYAIKLSMCEFLGVKPLFIARMAPKNYIERTRRAGGYTMLFGKQMYPFGHEELVQLVQERLELPVWSPVAVEAGTKQNFENWHSGVVRRLGGA